MSVQNVPSFSSTLGKDLSEDVFSAIVLSSLSQQWQGLDFIQYRHNLLEMVVASFPNHVITLNVGDPIDMRAKIGESVHQGCIKTNSLAIVPAGLTSEWYWQEQKPTNVIHLYLQPQFCREVALSCDLNPDRVEIVEVFAQPDPQIQHIGLALQAELQSGCMAGRLYGESLATALAIHLMKKYSTTKQNIPEYEDGLPHYKLNQVLEYIHAYLDQNIKLAELAGVAGMSQYYFCRLFKQSIGMAPHKYVIQQRVERAKQLLKHTDRAIADIALECGFYNQSHLTKHFRQLTGVTPKAYRQETG